MKQLALAARRLKKSDNAFQPLSLGFSHEKRTTFDGGALVRARVRFRTEAGYPVAWLDDLHKLHHHLRGGGEQQGAWQLPGGAPYASSTSMHAYVGGVKIWRVEGDKLRIRLYGRRSLLEAPRAYAVYAEVAVADATRWDPKAWQLLGPSQHHVTFKGLLKGVFPMILARLLDRPLVAHRVAHYPLVAQTPEDDAVRAEWAKETVAVYTE